MYFTIVQIIFHFIWYHCAYCGIFENGILLMYTLVGVGGGGGGGGDGACEESQ